MFSKDEICSSKVSLTSIKSSMLLTWCFCINRFNTSNLFCFSMSAIGSEIKFSASYSISEARSFNSIQIDSKRFLQTSKSSPYLLNDCACCKANCNCWIVDKSEMLTKLPKLANFSRICSAFSNLSKLDFRASNSPNWRLALSNSSH